MADLPVYYKGEVIFDSYGESMATGPWIKFRLPDSDELDAFRGLPAQGDDSKVTTLKGQRMYLAIVIIGDDERPTDVAPDPRPYAQLSRRLFSGGFFNAPQVLNAAGTQKSLAAYLFETCKTCALCQRPPERIVKVGGGTYDIAATCTDHRPPSARGKSSNETMLANTVKHRTEWASGEIKRQLGYDHWYQVPPGSLREWARKAGAVNILPKEYKDG